MTGPARLLLIGVALLTAAAFVAAYLLYRSTP